MRDITRFAVLASGSGSNLQAIIDAIEQEKFPARIVAVLSNKADAFALERAKKHNVPAFFINPKEFKSPQEYDQKVLEKLKEAGADYLVLAGYMRIISSVLVNAFPNRIVNIHPALLPSFGGKGMYGHHVHEAVIAHGCKVAGCTVHFVTEGVDEGPIIAQACVPVQEDDTPETLAKRVLEQEHKIYPQAIRWIAEGKVTVDGRRVRVG